MWSETYSSNTLSYLIQIKSKSHTFCGASSHCNIAHTPFNSVNLKHPLSIHRSNGTFGAKMSSPRPRRPSYVRLFLRPNYRYQEQAQGGRWIITSSILVDTTRRIGAHPHKNNLDLKTRTNNWHGRHGSQMKAQDFILRVEIIYMCTHTCVCMK